MAEALVVDLAVDVHAELLGDAPRREVLEPHERDQMVDLEVRERPVAGGGSGLGRDPLAFATGSRVPADLDLVDLLDQKETRAGGPEEGPVPRSSTIQSANPRVR